MLRREAGSKWQAHNADLPLVTWARASFAWQTRLQPACAQMRTPPPLRTQTSSSPLQLRFSCKAEPRLPVCLSVCLEQSGVLNIVMEYANGGDLAAAIQRRQAEKKPYSEDEIMFWWVGGETGMGVQGGGFRGLWAVGLRGRQQGEGSWGRGSAVARGSWGYTAMHQGTSVRVEQSGAGSCGLRDLLRRGTRA